MRSRTAFAALLLTLMTAAGARAQDDGLTQRVLRIFATSCATSGCHTGPDAPRGLQLDAAVALHSTVNVPSDERPEMRLVAPNDPESSYLLKKVRGDEDISGMQMPVTGGLLTGEELSAITEWIRSFPEAWGGPDEAGGIEGGGGGVGSAASTAGPGIFYDSSAGLLPTTETVGGGAWKFNILHRYLGLLQNSTLYDLGGLDFGANISLYFGYGITDAIEVGMRRSSALKHYEVMGRWRFLEGDAAGVPAAATLFTSWGNIDRRTPSPTPKSHISAQVALGVRPAGWLSLLMVPSYSSGTNVADAADEDGTIALGLAAEVRPMSDMALVVEAVPVLSGYGEKHASTTFGVKYRYGGHTFMLLATNAVEMHTDRYLPGSALDPRSRLRLGFNITRRIIH